MEIYDRNFDTHTRTHTYTRKHTMKAPLLLLSIKVLTAV